MLDNILFYQVCTQNYNLLHVYLLHACVIWFLFHCSARTRNHLQFAEGRLFIVLKLKTRFHIFPTRRVYIKFWSCIETSLMTARSYRVIGYEKKSIHSFIVTWSTDISSEICIIVADTEIHWIKFKTWLFITNQITPWLMEPGGSMINSQGLSYNPYLESNQPNYSSWLYIN